MINTTKTAIIAAVAATGALLMPAQQPAPGPDRGQPGTRFSEQQIREKVAPARAGAKLVPKWPNGARVAVVLSYDIDNESPLIDRDNLLPTALSETEYGATSGLPRILALLDRLSLPASFYVPAVSAMLAPDMVPAIMKSGRHEIALHGWIHESLPELNNQEEEARLLKQSIDYLTKVSGKKPAGTRAGAWALSPYSLDLIRKAGLLYDSSMMARDEPYNIMTDGKDSGLLELPVSWIEDDAPYFGAPARCPHQN